MGELYTNLMERAAPFLAANWQLAVIVCGAVFLLGGVLNWKWTWDPTGRRPFGLHAWAYRRFGEKGARVSTAVTGGVIVLCGALLWALM